MSNSKRLEQICILKRLIKVVSFLLVLIMLLLGYYFLNAKFHIGIPCIFYELTGYKCPGCGITRALFSLLKGDVVTAFRYNKLIFILAPFLGFYFIYQAYLYILGIEQSKKTRNNIQKVAIFFIVISLIYGVMRNFY